MAMAAGAANLLAGVWAATGRWLAWMGGWWCAVADREGRSYAALGIAVRSSEPTWLRWYGCEGGVESGVVVVVVVR